MKSVKSSISKNEIKGNFFVLLAALFWSTGGILLKYTVGNVLAINGFRSIFAYLFFVIYRKSFKIKLNKNNILAGLALLATNILFVTANKTTTAANAIVLQYIAPVLVLLWYCIYYKKKPRAIQIAAEIMAMAGMVLFFFDSLDAGQILGNILAIVSGITYSLFFFIDSLPDTSGDDACMLTFLASIAIGLPFTGSLFGEGSSAVSLIMLPVIGFMQLGLPHACYAYGCKLTSPVTSSLICLVEAILNPLWVFIFYGEAVGRFALIGAVIIIAAVVINILSSAKKPQTD